MRHPTDPKPLEFWSAAARIVCPCGCIFQAVSSSDECWTCGRSAGAIKAEEDRILTSIRSLPEVEIAA